MCVCVRACVRVCVCACVRACVRVCRCQCVDVSMCTHTETQTLTRSHPPFLQRHREMMTVITTTPTSSPMTGVKALTSHARAQRRSLWRTFGACYHARTKGGGGRERQTNREGGRTAEVDSKHTRIVRVCVRVFVFLRIPGCCALLASCVLSHTHTHSLTDTHTCTF